MPPEALVMKKQEKEINNFVGFSQRLEQPSNNVWKQGHILNLKSPSGISSVENGNI
jgi:hypothetical protein